MKSSGIVSHWFYVGVAVLMILLNIAAFVPSRAQRMLRLLPISQGAPADLCRYWPSAPKAIS